jgi:hypothetical protein
MAAFQPGDYAVSVSPFPADAYQTTAETVTYTHTRGVGVWPVTAAVPIERPNQTCETFHWHNDHYTAELDANGQVRLGQAVLGRLSVRREPATPTPRRAAPGWERWRPSPRPCCWRRASGMLWSATRLPGSAATNGLPPRCRCSSTPPRSCAGRCTSTRAAQTCAWMLFSKPGWHQDTCRHAVRHRSRQGTDTDLLPRQLEGELGAILLGQRELNAVRTFPFQDFVALSDGERSAAIFARGLRAYTVVEPGSIRLPLRRSVEWLTRPGLQDRVGDAGPFFYVPGARCERSERHELGFAAGGFAPDSIELAALNDSFQNPPLLVRGEGRGQLKSWQFLRENLPLSSLQVQDGRVVARLYNPTGQRQRLSRPYPQVNLWGQPTGEIEIVEPKKIVTVVVEPQEFTPVESDQQAALLNPPAWRVGESASRPDPAVIAELGEKVSALEAELVQVQRALGKSQGSDKLRLQHRTYVLERELVEYLFSQLLNARKLARSGPPTEEDLFSVDPEIAALGLRLNKLRIKRRIFDYVVEVLRE